jgi:CHAT domain-containing protein
MVLTFLEQRRDKEALQLWEWFRVRSGAEERAATEKPWNEIKKEIFKPLPLGSETRLIYGVFEDRLQIWIANNGEIKSKRVFVKQQDIEEQVREFARECSLPESDFEEIRRQSVKLGALFFDEASPFLKSSESVLIELDPRIDQLPLVALIGPNGAYFDEDHAIVRSSGIWPEEAQREAEPITKDMSVLVADASPAAGPDFLPGHQNLADGVSSVFTGTLVRHPVNTKWTEVSREIGSKEVFIFIGHGVRSGDGTALVYGNLRLTAKDFPRESLRHLDLAVLIACSSAAGGKSGPQGVDSLVQHFLAAGVPSVIGSQWDVDSRTTTRLMEEFHRRLGSGQRPSLALSLARKQVRQEKPLPYYWAAFDLDGRAN